MLFCLLNVNEEWKYVKNLSKMATQDGVGEVDIASIQSEIKDKPTKRKNKYAKYTPEDRYSIGKHASENGPIAAVRKFNSKFANLNESTARTFRDKYEEQIAVATKKGTVTEKYHFSLVE